MWKDLRRWSVGLAALCLSLSPVAGVRADELKQGDLVAVCGDSITEQKDYSVNIEMYLLACRAAGPVRTAQFGWSGDRLPLLLGRGGQNHILAMQPTVITTCYGMNDGGYKPVEETTLNTYRDGMEKLVQAFKAKGVRLIIIGSPGAVDSDTWRQDPAQAAMYNKTLAALRDVANAVADKNGCLFANVHDPMIETMARAKKVLGPQYHVAGGDGVHPSANGHLVMAYAFLKAMGLDGEIGTFEVDLASGKATATPGHTILSSAGGKVEIESTRYPFCFGGKEADPSGTRSILPFLPFNQELNRLTLKVSNPGAKTVRVTWGTASKEFDAQQLAGGINLAAEFLDNPFYQPFMNLRASVLKKQAFETVLYKTGMAGLQNIVDTVKDVDSEAAGTAEKINAALVKKDAQIAANVAAELKPVKHTILIEPLK